MKIAEFLSPDAVIESLASTDKRGILHELCERVARIHPQMSEEELFLVLASRERLGSTGLGEGVAIPHGKIRGLPGLVGCLARSREGVNFDSLDGNPTRLFFALFAPESSAGLHLKALARISRLFRNARLRERIMEAQGAAQIYRLVLDEDEGVS